MNRNGYQKKGKPFTCNLGDDVRGVEYWQVEWFNGEGERMQVGVDTVTQVVVQTLCQAQATSAGGRWRLQGGLGAVAGEGDSRKWLVEGVLRQAVH